MDTPDWTITFRIFQVGSSSSSAFGEAPGELFSLSILTIASSRLFSS